VSSLLEFWTSGACVSRDPWAWAQTRPTWPLSPAASGCGPRARSTCQVAAACRMKMVRIFSNRIRDRIRLERLRSVRIRVRMFNIRYRIRIRIFKSYIYDVDIQSYLIRHCWYYSYSNSNPTKNMKINMISVISVRIRSVFIPTPAWWMASTSSWQSAPWTGAAAAAARRLARAWREV